MKKIARYLCALLLIFSLIAIPNARAYRDPETGTFITRDPLGFVDGPNMYTYVNQNPWSKYDPEGLFTDGNPVTPEEVVTAPPFAASVVLILHTVGVILNHQEGMVNDYKGSSIYKNQIGGVTGGFDKNPIPKQGVITSPGTDLTKFHEANEKGDLQGARDALEAEEKNAETKKGSKPEGSAKEERKKYRKKGVSDSQLGPSGKPKRHEIEKPTTKEAKEGARNSGGNAPVQHNQDRGQSTHYHPTNADGTKRTGARNQHFKKRGEKQTPNKTSQTKTQPAFKQKNKPRNEEN